MPIIERSSDGPVSTEKECRICLATSSPSDSTDDFVAPCRCSGSMKWVHRDCLAEWMRKSTDPIHREQCSTCRFAYLKKHRLRRLSECLRALVPHIGWTVAQAMVAGSINALLESLGYECWQKRLYFDLLVAPFVLSRVMLTRDNAVSPYDSVLFSNDCMTLFHLAGYAQGYLQGGWTRVVELSNGWSTLSTFMLYALSHWRKPRWKVYQRLAEGTIFEGGMVSDAPPLLNHERKKDQ